MFELFSGSSAIIACLVVGLLLIVVEALTPGLGLPGLMGSVMLLGGSVLVWFSYGLTKGLITMLCSLVLTAAAVLFSLHSASKGKLSKSDIVLDEKTESPAVIDASGLIGLIGVAVTPLNPVGTILADGRKIDVFSSDGFIPKGTRITVTCTEGNKVYVSKCS